MRPDTEIRHDVEEELDWDPQIGTCDIAVAVRNGVVTLAGFVHSFGDRAQAEADVKRVKGVAAIANDIEVRLPLVSRKSDPEIAHEVVAGLEREVPVAFEQIRVRVAEGRVTLEGEVEWEHDRKRAEEVALRVRGIRSVRNDIVVKPQLLPIEIKRKIEAAFELSAEIDADSIVVGIADNGTVILTGTVRSMAERDAAERAAWSTPGVRQVDNRIEVTA
jgi:osmotically-inducible protein OsmY